METIENIERFKNRIPLVLSIGMFDGVHKGHRAIIKKLNNIAERKNFASALLTFSPHPRLLFNPNDNLKFLNTSTEKAELLKKTGIDYFFIQNFNNDFRNLTGEEFVKKILLEQLNVKYLIVGYDHSFGKNRSGNFELLQKMASAYDFEVEQMKAVSLESKNISSTKIRNAIMNGHIKEANDMLGYHYFVSGKVVDGKKLGRTIGYPTANIQFDNEKLLPKDGAYIVSVDVEHQKYKGMLSIGTNPTVDGKNYTMEVHILDFNDDIYGKKITVNFYDFLHEQIKFNDIKALITKLDEDKRKTEAFFNS